MNKNKVNKQLGKGLERDFSEVFKTLGINRESEWNEMNDYISEKMPLEKPISRRKFNRIMNKMAHKFGKRLYKSLSKEDMNKLSALSKEFGKDKIRIIEQYQKSKEYWVDELPDDPEE